MNIVLDSNKIDWKQLRTQKETLVSLLLQARVEGNEAGDVEGILGLIDYMQDRAAEVLGERDVFGEIG